MSEPIEFPSNPGYNILNQPLTWLYTHCLSLGMNKKSEPKTAECDIALFVADLSNENEKLRATQIPPGFELAPVGTRENLQKCFELLQTLSNSMSDYFLHNDYLLLQNTQGILSRYPQPQPDEVKKC